MRALPVRPEPLWRTDFRQRIAVSLWFLPSVFAAAAIAAANLTMWLDARVDAPIGVRPDLVSDPGTAATFAGAIAAATLAFVAVVFATTLVAIQLAASQYSPRTVRIFIRSRLTRVTLGVFLSTFVFAVIILVSNRASVTSAKQFAPVVSVTTLLALTVATVFGFVAYLHGVVRLMRVQYLLEAIAIEKPAGHRGELPAGVRLRRRRASPARPLTASPLLHRDGRGRDGHRPARPGRIVPAAGVLARTGRRSRRVPGSRHPGCARTRRGLRDRDVTRFFLIRGERTFVQDPAFGFRQLVDVAIRALSPAVNDPTTGVQAIDRISDLLAITGNRLDPTGWRVDSTGTVRVKRKLRNFDGLLVLSLTEVIRYGADAPQVARRLHAMLDELEATLPAERQAAIAGQRSLLEAAISAALPAPFASVASAADREGLG